MAGASQIPFHSGQRFIHLPQHLHGLHHRHPRSAADTRYLLQVHPANPLGSPSPNFELSYPSTTKTVTLALLPPLIPLPSLFRRAHQGRPSMVTRRLNQRSAGRHFRILEATIQPHAILHCSPRSQSNRRTLILISAKTHLLRRYLRHDMIYFVLFLLGIPFPRPFPTRIVFEL